MSESKLSKTTPVAVPQEVTEWMECADSQPREFIVQADLPKRKVSLSFEKGRRVFAEIASEADSVKDRLEILERLMASIAEVAPDDAKVLKSAGAIAVRVLPKQLQQIAALPGIAEIRINRKFSGRPKK